MVYYKIILDLISYVIFDMLNHKRKEITNEKTKTTIPKLAVLTLPADIIKKKNSKAIFVLFQTIQFAVCVALFAFDNYVNNE